MKKAYFFSNATLVSIVFSCKQQNSQENNHQSQMINDSRMTDNDSTIINHKLNDNDKMYFLLVHSEVHGNKNDKCSRCGRD